MRRTKQLKRNLQTIEQHETADGNILVTTSLGSSYAHAVTEAVITEALKDQSQPLRVQILEAGRDLTLGDRNISYGDPLENHEAIAALKRAFWDAVYFGGNTPHFEQNSAFGCAIDAILTNLGRIASAPSRQAMLAMDRYIDAATYTATAYEIGMRLQLEKPQE